MLVFRSTQLDTLITSPLVTFAQRLRVFFSREHAWLLSPVPEEDRIERITAALRVALAAGMKTEWDLCRFVILELQEGPTFGRPEGPAWALEILSDDDNTGTGKADALDHYFYQVLGNETRREVH